MVVSLVLKFFSLSRIFIKWQRQRVDLITTYKMLERELIAVNLYGQFYLIKGFKEVKEFLCDVHTMKKTVELLVIAVKNRQNRDVSSD